MYFEFVKVEEPVVQSIASAMSRKEEDVSSKALDSFDYAARKAIEDTFIIFNNNINNNWSDIMCDNDIVRRYAQSACISLAYRIMSRKDRDLLKVLSYSNIYIKALRYTLFKETVPFGTWCGYIQTEFDRAEGALKMRNYG